MFDNLTHVMHNLENPYPAGNSLTNNSNLTNSTLHESLVPYAEYRVYFTSIYVILRV